MKKRAFLNSIQEENDFFHIRLKSLEKEIDELKTAINTLVAEVRRDRFERAHPGHCNNGKEFRTTESITK